MIALQARQLCKTFPGRETVHLFSNIDLTVPQGKSVAILGASGQGKSTLLQILGTLESPTSGTLSIFGETVSSKNRSRLRNQTLGFIFQSFHLLEEESVLDNVLMPASIAGKAIDKQSESYARALALLERVQMSHRLHFLAKQLSGGEKQRVAIARAFCNDPQLYFADEPSGNLDAKNAAFVYELLLEPIQKEKKSLIVVTHDQNLANLCDLRYLLSGGQLIPL